MIISPVFKSGKNAMAHQREHTIPKEKFLRGWNVSNPAKFRELLKPAPEKSGEPAWVIFFHSLFTRHKCRAYYQGLVFSY